MSKMRKLLHLILVFTLTLGLLWPPSYEPYAVFAAEAEPMSGTIGSLSWELTEDEPSKWDLTQGTPYKLTLTGSGEMEGGIPPWEAYRSTITSVSIAEGITTIGSSAFYQCVSLKSVTIPDSVTRIGSNAFKGCTLLETVNFGKNIQEIGLYAFENCIGLKSVAVPDSVTVIGGSAFKGCTSLEAFVCGAGLTEIGSFAFNKTAISEIHFQEGLEIIGDHAFYNSPLERISLPSTVTSMGRMAFAGTSLSELIIPESVAAIGAGVLYDVKTLKNILVAENNPYFYVQDDALYEKKADRPYRVIIYVAASDSDAVSIADGTEIIDEYAFSQASNLVSVHLPDTLKKMEQAAFSHCSNLREIAIPDSVETIGTSAFAYNTSLTAVSIGKGLTKCFGTVFSGCVSIETVSVSQENPFLESVDNVIYNEACTELYFYAPAKEDKSYRILDTVETISSSSICMASMLEELFMPENLTQIYSRAISDNSNLRAIYFPGDAPNNTGSAISYCSQDLILYRREATVGWEHSSWSSYVFADWTPENDTKDEGIFGELRWSYEGEIGRIVFTGTGAIPDFTEEEPAPWSAYMDEIQTIEAEGVTNIGDYCFYCAGKLVFLKTGDALREIGDFAFADCGKLALVNLSGLDVIGAAAFRNNTSLKDNLTLERVASVGEEAFKGCSGITDVTLGTVLTSLEREAFADCTSLNSFLVPNSVSVIKEGAFKGCESLRTINIPTGVTTIGTQAFSGSTALEKVYFYGGIPSVWESDSFEDCSEALTLYYRKAQTDWEKLDGVWNALPLVGLERFYTEGRDHYSFGNTIASFGYSAGYRFPRQRYVDVLDSIVTGTYYYAINKNWNGSCYGMAVSTIEFYENTRLNVSDYSAGAESLYDIKAPGDKNAALTKLIEGYQISQYKTQIAGYGGSVSRHRGAYREMIQKVEEFERSGGLGIDSKADPIVILVGARNNAHAVVPVSVDQDVNGDFLLQVYDPNIPSELQTLKIYKDFHGISYGMCMEASYIEYSAIADAMSDVTLHENEGDASLYFSIDKEKGKVVSADGRDITEIEGAYEQKPFAVEEDTFSGIKSFVLPKGNYQISAEEADQDGNVTFYLASNERFAQITSTDANAVLTVKEEGTESGGLEISLQSKSTKEETSEFIVMNRLGMERTIEVGGANAAVAVLEDDTITVEVLEGETVCIDKTPVELEEQKAVSSFTASEGENPWKMADIEVSAVCNEKNELSGKADVTVISNNASAKDVTVTAVYLDKNGKEAASYTEKRQMNAGLNTFALFFENLETDFEETEGDVSLSCVLTVKDMDGNVVTATVDGLTVSLTKQPDTEKPKPEPEEPDTEQPKPEPEEPDTEQPKPEPEEPDTEQPKPEPEEPDTEKPKPNTPVKIAVTGVKAEVDRLTLGVGESFRLNASAVPDNASDKTLVYTSSNQNIKVDTTGNIVAKKTGSSQITVSAANGEKTVVTVIVKKAPKKIQLRTTKKTLKAGKTFQIKIKLPKNTASHKITYSSSKKSVASVSSSGKITAKKRGTTTITVKTFNGKKAKLKLTVKGEVAVKKVVVTAKALTLGIGETVWLNAAVLPENASNKKLTFRASNKKVTVDSKGKITAKKVGTCTVTVKASNGKKAVIKVTVKKVRNALPIIYD